MRALLVVIGLAVAHVGCFGGDCTEGRLLALEFALPTDAAMQFRLDRCELDAETCVEVCTLAMERDQFFAPVTHCKVTPEPTRVVLLAGYEVPSNNGTCAFSTGDDVLEGDSPRPPSGN
jgi:hypothetical protein